MGKPYTLPIELDKVDLRAGLSIDMSSTNFPVSKEKQKRAAFIFIRNTNINAVCLFNKCEYSDKAEYLMLYMKSNIVVAIPDLITTWINIIANGYMDVSLTSILSKDEIEMFCKENNDFVNEMRTIAASIPLVSISYYQSVSTDDSECVIDIEQTSFNSFNNLNYMNMLDYDDFVCLVNEFHDIKPKYYINFFGNNNPFYGKLISKFPYVNIMNVIMGNEEGMNSFIDALTALINEGNYEEYTELIDDVPE